MNKKHKRREEKVRNSTPQGQFTLDRTEKISIMLNVIVTMGIISFLFLVIYISYQQILLLSANKFKWDFAWWVLENEEVYNRGLQLLTLIYIIVLIIGITYQFIRSRNQIALSYIRHYISLMAQGNYQLRVPEAYAGEYLKLAQDVNILIENINQAFYQRDQSEKSKEELMNNIGHDIRTPLTSVIGYLDLVKKNPDLDHQTRLEYIDVAYSKSKEMRGLVNDFFDYTSSLGSTIKLEVQAIPIHGFLEQIAADFYLEAQKLNIQIETRVADPDYTANFDPEKMARVFNNLISNALKYGHGATQITLVALVEELKKNSKSQSTIPHLILEVRNNGELINEDELEKIFERSYRTDQSRNSARKGSGLGLSIVKNFIEAHQGRIFAKNQGQELVFRIELPQDKAD